jgi:hypothetical protein
MMAMKPLDRVVVTVHIESFNGTPGTASEVRNFTTGTIDTQVRPLHTRPLARRSRTGTGDGRERLPARCLPRALHRARADGYER